MENFGTESLGKKIQETLHRVMDQMQSNIKPETEHGEQTVRDTEAKIRQDLKR